MDKRLHAHWKLMVNSGVGTRGGLVYYAPDTDTPQFFNRGNSGLAGNWVLDIEKSDDGQLWAATTRGLGVWDGSTWVRHDSIRGAQLALMSDGSIAAATTGKLYRWIDDQWMLDEYFGCGYAVTDMEVNPIDGDIWITGYTFGCISVDRFDGTTWTHYDYNNSTLPFESPNNNSIEITQDGVVWVGTWNSLHRFKNETWEQVDLGGILQENPAIFSLEEAPNGDLWGVAYSSLLGSPDFDIHLVRFDGNEWVAFPIPDTLQTYLGISVILPTADDFFLGTSGKGLFQTDLTNYTPVETNNSPLPGNQVAEIVADGPQMWLGTNIYTNVGNAVASIEGQDWDIYDPDFNVRLKFVDAEGKLWAMSDQYNYYTLENGNWSPVNFAALGAPDLQGVVNIALDTEANLWLFGNIGVARYDGSEWTTFDVNQTGIINGIYLDVAFDPANNDLWIGTYYGAVRYNGSQWQNFTFQGNPISNQPAVYDFAFGADGAIYTATQFGLFVKSGTIFTLVDGFGIDHFEYGTYSLFMEENQDLWVGGRDYMVRYNDGVQEVFDLQNSGLPDGNVSSIAQDDNGNLWLGTDSGLALYNPDGVDWSNTHTAVESAMPQFDFRLSPNPVGLDDRLFIRLGQPANKQVQVRLMDVQGRIVQAWAFANVGTQLSVDLKSANLSSGIYVVQVASEFGIGVGKIVVE